MVGIQMNVFQKVVSWFKKSKLNNDNEIEPVLISFNAIDYQESSMENYLSGCCINALY
jgi:hypothetical protein